MSGELLALLGGLATTVLGWGARMVWGRIERLERELVPSLGRIEERVERLVPIETRLGKVENRLTRVETQVDISNGNKPRSVSLPVEIVRGK